jgi:UDP-glucose 4-epimerase
LILDELIEQSDVVYFLAGSVGVKNVVEHPYETQRNNLELALSIIPAAARHNKLVLFASTSEVYGEGPFTESAALTIGAPTNLRWSYASAKLTTEFLLSSCGAPYRILRFFNITGPGQLPDYGMVLPRFVKSALKNEDIIVYGDGLQIRSFCHITDAITMMQQVELLDSGIYNIGSDHPVTIYDLACTVKQVLNSRSNIVLTPLSSVYTKNSGDISCRIPDLSKLRNNIDYKTTKTLEDIIMDIAHDKQ